MEYKLKEENEEVVSYYYEINQQLREENAGIVECDKVVLEKFEHSEDLTLSIMEAMIDQKMRIVKNCSEPYLLEDGIDANAIRIFKSIVESYLQTREFPKNSMQLDKQLFEKLLHNEEKINRMIENGDITKEELEEIKQLLHIS